MRCDAARCVDDKGRTLIVHTAQEAPKEQVQAPRPKIVLDDFEGKDYGDWKATGEAFGKGPAHGTLASQQQVSGFLGEGLVNTFLGGDRPHGTLTSPAFEISRKYINFLIGGGSHADQTCINLLVDDKVVRTATGKDNEKLEWSFWNVEDLQGKTATIQIVDRNSGGWGHINIDQIELADEPYQADLGPFDKLPDYGSLVLALPDETGIARTDRQILESAADWAKELYAAADVTYPVTENTQHGRWHRNRSSWPRVPSTRSPSSWRGSSPTIRRDMSTRIASRAPPRSLTTCSTTTTGWSATRRNGTRPSTRTARCPAGCCSGCTRP